MAETAAPEPARSLRAETILMTALGVVSLIVITMGLLLLRAERQHTNEEAVVERVRAARHQLIQASQAQNDAEAIVARYTATGDRGLLTEFDTAKRIAREHMVALQSIVADDGEASAFVGRIEGLGERRFAALDNEASNRSRGRSGQRPDTTIYAALRAENGALFTLLNSRIDDARAAENATRLLVSVMIIALGALSLVGSGLAIFALRRERTQWRLAHAAAEEARARAAASDIAKTRFLAVASHDMRQPLHALTLYLTALERRVESVEAREIVSKMDRAVQSMIGMFASLLDLARLQAGVITPEIVETPMQPILDAAMAEHPGGKVEAAATAIAVRSDPRLLERIVSNLVGNAVKHGGSARILVSAEGGHAHITIADDGPGIAPEDQERIFTEFERLGARSDGLGLGLTIVRRLAELLDIGITLDSAAGDGARFTLRLPLASVQQRAPTRIVSADALRDVPVLTMDDDALAREAIAGLLTDLGADVRACDDGAGAEAIVRGGFAPRLLVLDLRIHGELRGLDIARRLREAVSPSPPVIMVTGDTESTTLEALRASGFAWLIKPIDPADLSAAATALLQGEQLSST